MALALPVEGITPRVQEIGRIRMGEKNGRGLPVKLKTFRLTSNDRKVLEAAAALYGGQVSEWKDAPDEGMWQVVTAASALDILIPRSLRTISQAWELWQGGTCERRCDGRTEEISGQPCLCGPARGSSDDVCDILTRLSVILPRIPGLGVWRLDTGGWNAATTLPATVDFLLAIDARPLVPAVLRAVQASSKARDPKTGKVETHRFVRPMLDSPGLVPYAELLGTGAEPVAQLEPGERPAPPTAEERVARQRAELEARKVADAGVSDPVALAASQPAPASAAAEPDAPVPEPTTADAAAPGASTGLDEADTDAVWRELGEEPAAPAAAPAEPVVPAAMSSEEFVAFIAEHRISAAYAKAAAESRFGKGTRLTPEQRAELARELTKEG